MKYLLILVTALLLLAGCESLDRPIAAADAQAKVDQVAAMVDHLKAYADSLAQDLAAAQAFINDQDQRLTQARALAEASHSDAALAVVASIEHLRDQAQAGLPTLLEAVDTARAKIPQAEQILAQMRTQAAALPAGGQSPLWYVLGTLLLPIAIKAAQVGAAGIPGVGPLVSSVAETAITGLWNTLATARLKAHDATLEARSAALDHQVAVTHALIEAAGDKAQPILDTAKAQQKAAGVHATLEPIVAALEAKA